MNILLINHYAGSPRHGMEYRGYYLAREWVRLGHQVQIIACSQSHVRARQPVLDSDVLVEDIDGIRYTWYAGPPYEGNGVKRVLNMAAFVWRLFREGRAIAKAFKPDVVIASSTYPMDIWPAYRIAERAGARLVFEVHDLWPLSPMELGGMSKWHPFIMLVQAAEDFAYRHADVVVSMLPNVREYMESRGMAASKLFIVPNGIHPEEWTESKAPLRADVAGALGRLRESGTSIVGYAGTHGLANALDTFLDAARIMREERVAFVLVGGGPEKERLRMRAEQEDLKNVTFIDPVEKSEIPALLRHLDIAYIGLQSQPLFRFGIAPNKLMDYMMAGRAVVMAIDAGNDPVLESGCGVSVAPENASAVVEGIRNLLSAGPQRRDEMGKRGQEFVLKNHTYPILAKEFLKACGVQR